jgi:hypothetical protein
LLCRARELPRALDLFNSIISKDSQNSVWYERRGQVLVDLDRFDEAVADFNRAETMQADNYVSLGLLSNRALAYEGLSDWKVLRPTCMAPYCGLVVRLAGTVLTLTLCSPGGGAGLLHVPGSIQGARLDGALHFECQGECTCITYQMGGGVCLWRHSVPS